MNFFDKLLQISNFFDRASLAQQQHHLGANLHSQVYFPILYHCATVSSLLNSFSMHIFWILNSSVSNNYSIIIIILYYIILYYIIILNFWKTCIFQNQSYIFAPRCLTEIKQHDSETPAPYLFVVFYYFFHLNQDFMVILQFLSCFPCRF